MVEVIDLAMAAGTKDVAIQRGYDPRELPLVVAGGAGPVHAGAIARRARACRRSSSRASRRCSARSACCSPTSATTSRAASRGRGRPSTPARRARVLDGSLEQGMAALEREGVPPEPPRRRRRRRHPLRRPAPRGDGRLPARRPRRRPAPDRGGVPPPARGALRVRVAGQADGGDRPARDGPRPTATRSSSPAAGAAAAPRTRHGAPAARCTCARPAALEEVEVLDGDRMAAGQRHRGPGARGAWRPRRSSCPRRSTSCSTPPARSCSVAEAPADAATRSSPP